MGPLTKEWLDKAEGDRKVAEREWRTKDPVCDAVSFHAQQCVEKYLKAWLTEQKINFPKTHDLQLLAKLAKPSCPELTPAMEELEFLTSSSVEIRYPGVSAEIEDAEKCLKAMRHLRDILRKKLLDIVGPGEK